MAKLLQTLIPLLFCIIMLPNQASSRETTFTFTSFVSAPTDLTYQGDAHVPSGAKFLRLTKTDGDGLPEPASVGRAVYTKPFKLWENNLAVSFNTTIKFTITPPKYGESADGLAFFIAPVGTTIPEGAYGGNFGLFDVSGKSPAFFAVEFDLYSNNWDPSNGLRHIGIDVNSIKSETFVEFDDACIGKEAELDIQYDGVALIRVMLTCGAQIRLLEQECDLGRILPPKVQVGIASSTGDLVAIHDVSYWSFRSAERAIDDGSES